MFADMGGIATLRYLARVDTPMPFVKNDRFSLINWDEIFINYNSNEALRAGYSENRLFTGGAYKFSKNLTLELGYMLQHLSRAGDDSLNHWLFTSVVINL
jgi:hypothetical protein